MISMATGVDIQPKLFDATRLWNGYALVLRSARTADALAITVEEEAS